MRKLPGVVSWTRSRILISAVLMAQGWAVHADGPMRRQEATLPGKTYVQPVSPQVQQQQLQQQEQLQPQAVENLEKQLTELRAEHKSLQDLVNSVNPFSDNFTKTPSQQMNDPNVERLRVFLSYPIVQKLMRLISNSEFQKAASELKDNPKWRVLIQWEIAWMIAILVLRAWRLSKAKHWFRRLLESTWTLALFWGGAFVLMPGLVLGSAYYKISSMMMGVLGGS